MADDRLLPNVKKALRKDGWKVEPKGLTISSKDFIYIIDVEAEKDGQKILVEVKTWQENFNHCWFEAYGQYITYQEAVNQELPEYLLYLAVPENIYNTKFNNPWIQGLLAKNSIKLLIFDSSKNTVVAWK